MDFYTLKEMFGFAGHSWVSQQEQLINQEALSKIYIADIKLRDKETIALIVEGISVACLSDENTINNLITHMNNIREHYVEQKMEELGVYDEMLRLGILNDHLKEKEGKKNGK